MKKIKKFLPSGFAEFSGFPEQRVLICQDDPSEEIKLGYNVRQKSIKEQLKSKF